MKVYSVNGEMFEEELYDVIQDWISNDPEIKIGDVLTVDAGEVVECKTSEFYSNTHVYQTIESLMENAHDEMGENSEDWLREVTDEEEEDLIVRIKKALDEWSADNGHAPLFSRVINVKQEKYKILNIDDLEYEEAL